MNIISAEDLFNKVPELKTIDVSLCVRCKATQLLCGLRTCPLLKAVNQSIKTETRVQEIKNLSEINAPSPQIFVGHRHYPKVYAGPSSALFPDETDPSLLGNPSKWVGMGLNEVIEMRFGMLRGMQKVDVKGKSRVQEQLESLSLSVNPTEIEAKLSREIQFSQRFDTITQPYGPSGEFSKFNLSGNPKIPSKVDMILEDDLNSRDQLNGLYNSGLDVYYLQNAFSSGAFGRQEASKMVPTRWSITAVDDQIGKILLKKIQDFSSVNNILAFHGGHLGNYFTILIFPGSWKFENFETWFPQTIYTLGMTTPSISYDFEGFSYPTQYSGLTRYSVQAGGYYAARLSILEKLYNMRKQGSVLSIREITPEYMIPAGVWVVREAAKSALEGQIFQSHLPEKRKGEALVFHDKNEAINWLQSRLISSIDFYKTKSKLIGQTSLTDFLM